MARRKKITREKLDIPEYNIQFSLNINDIRRFAGWSFFVGIFGILGGLIQFLSFVLIIPVFMGVFTILSSIKILSVSKALRKFIIKNDSEKIQFAFRKLKTYFFFMGINAILSLCLIVLVLILILIGVMSLSSLFGGFIIET